MRLVCCDRRDPLRDRIDVDRRRLVALEPEQDRLVAAVALAGEPEAAEQLDLHAAPCCASWPSASSRSANRRAARIGPTVCELDGPMPILKMSKTLMCTAAQCTRQPCQRRAQNRMRVLMLVGKRAIACVTSCETS